MLIPLYICKLFFLNISINVLKTLYSCCNLGKTNKTKIIILSAIGVSVLGASYYFFTSPKNGAVLALSGLLGFAACPVMCAVMGGVMWMASRLGRRNQKEISNDLSCGSEHANEFGKRDLRDSN